MNDDIGKARITCPVCGTETTVPLDEWEEIVERHNDQRHGGDVGADLEEAILPESKIRTDGGIDQSVDGTDRSYDPHADDFCVCCGRRPNPGLTMHPVVSIENGTICEVCTHAV